MGKLIFSGALFAYVGFIGLLTVNDVMTSKKENGLYDLKHECIASMNKFKRKLSLTFGW